MDSSNNIEFSLTTKEKHTLLKLARDSIHSNFNKSQSNVVDEDYSGNLLVKTGAFVTIHKKGQLRGCIGTFSDSKPLYQNIIEMAKAAAFNDPRFDGVKEVEMLEIEIEISVLTPMQKIDSVDEIILGKHGIYIKSGFHHGTFLPQVADDTGWSKDEFLGHCARDKAGIGWEGWKTADVFIYEALVFSEHN